MSTEAWNGPAVYVLGKAFLGRVREPTEGLDSPRGATVDSMSGDSGWLDEVVEGRLEWVRTGRDRIESELRPGLPCRIVAGEVDGFPVLYMAVGVNGTLHYWQTATVDQESRRPLPRTEALRHVWQVLDLVEVISRSEVNPRLIDWSKEVA